MELHIDHILKFALDHPDDLMQTKIWIWWIREFMNIRDNPRLSQKVRDLKVKNHAEQLRKLMTMLNGPDIDEDAINSIIQ